MGCTLFLSKSGSQSNNSEELGKYYRSDLESNDKWKFGSNNGRGVEKRTNILAY